MSIYQEEMMRKLPKLGCTETLGKKQKPYATVCFSVKQLKDSMPLYTDDKSIAQNLRKNFAAISD